MVEEPTEQGELPREFLLRVVQGKPIAQMVRVNPKRELAAIYEEQVVYATFKERLRAASTVAPYYHSRLSRILADAGRSDDEKSFHELMAELSAALPQ